MDEFSNVSLPDDFLALNRYAHSLMPHKHEAMNRLGKLF